MRGDDGRIHVSYHLSVDREVSVFFIVKCSVLELTYFQMYVFAKRLRPYRDCDNLTKTPGVGDAVPGEPGKVLAEDYEEIYVDAEYCGIEEDDEG